MSKFFELAMKFCANSLLPCRTNFHREFSKYLVDGLSLKNVVIRLPLLRMRLAWYFRRSLKISFNRAKNPGQECPAYWQYRASPTVLLPVCRLRPVLPNMLTERGKYE